MLRQSVKTIDTAELPIQPIDWRGLHRDYLNVGEMEIIAALVRDAQVMIEIGCRDGRTARVLLDNVPSLARYIGIDVPTDYQPSIVEQRSETVAAPGRHAWADPRFELIIRPRGSFDLDELESCDAVFIDGDHSRRVVAHDSALALAAIRAGGVIIWHDYQNDHINDVTDVLLGLAAAGWAIKHVRGTWLAFLRI